MIKAKKRTRTVEYVPKTERGQENPATFKLKSLTYSQRKKHQDRLIKVSAEGKIEEVSAGQVRTAIVKQMLVGWSNIVHQAEGEEDSPLGFSRSTVDDLYDLLPDEVLEELEANFGDGTIPEGLELK